MQIAGGRAAASQVVPFLDAGENCFIARLVGRQAVKPPTMMVLGVAAWLKPARRLKSKCQPTLRATRKQVGGWVISPEPETRGTSHPVELLPKKYSIPTIPGQA